MKLVRQHRELAKNAPIGGPNLARIRDFQVFRDLGAHEGGLERPKTFSITHKHWTLFVSTLKRDKHGPCFGAGKNVNFSGALGKKRVGNMSVAARSAL